MSNRTKVATKRKKRLRRIKRTKPIDPARARSDIQSYLDDVDQLSLLNDRGDFKKLIQKVLAEDFSDTVQINGTTIQLKVLKAGPAMRVAKAVGTESQELVKILTGGEELTGPQAIFSCIDGLAKAAAILLPHYGLEDYNDPETIVDKLEASEIQDLCYAQLRVQERADFLLDPLRPICGITRIGLMMMRQLTEGLQQDTSSTEKSPETQPSA